VLSVGNIKFLHITIKIKIKQVENDCPRALETKMSAPDFKGDTGIL
jgi:hypothetical protein